MPRADVARLMRPYGHRYVRDPAGEFALVALPEGKEMARTIQLVTEYDPHPPFERGAKSEATSRTIGRARQIIRKMYA